MQSPSRRQQHAGLERKSRSASHGTAFFSLGITNCPGRKGLHSHCNLSAIRLVVKSTPESMARLLSLQILERLRRSPLIGGGQYRPDVVREPHVNAGHLRPGLQIVSQIESLDPGFLRPVQVALFVGFQNSAENHVQAVTERLDRKSTRL